MLGLRTEVFAQRMHRNVHGCVPITKELESAEVLETTHVFGKILDEELHQLGLPPDKRRAPGFKVWEPLSGRRAAFSNTRIFLNPKYPPLSLPAIRGNSFVSA